MPLLAGGRKITILPPAKHRHYGQRFKKWPDLNFVAAVVFGLSSAGLADFSSASFKSFLSVGFASFFKPAAAAGFLSVTGLAATSAPSGNSVRNCVEFCDLG